MYGVRYTVLGADGHAVLEEGKKGDPHAACYYDYNFKFHQRGNKWGIHTIQCFVERTFEYKMRTWSAGEYVEKVIKQKLPLTKEQVVHHLENLQSVFPTHLTDDGDEYLIELRESEYVNHTQIRAALDFIRLMWEDGICEVLPEYFKFIAKYELKSSYFMAIQAVFVWLRMKGKAAGGHSLPCLNYYSGGCGTIVTEEEFFKGLKTDVKETQTGGSFGLWNWIDKSKQGKENDEESRMVDHTALQQTRKTVTAQLKAINLLEDADSIEKIIKVIETNK